MPILLPGSEFRYSYSSLLKWENVKLGWLEAMDPTDIFWDSQLNALITISNDWVGIMDYDHNSIIQY